MEEQSDNIIFGKLFNSTDFEDWMKCVSQVEEKRNEIFIGNQFGECQAIFRLDTGQRKKKQEFTFANNNFDEKKDRWEEIKSKIRIDPTLDQEKG